MPQIGWWLQAESDSGDFMSEKQKGLPQVYHSLFHHHSNSNIRRADSQGHWRCGDWVGQEVSVCQDRLSLLKSLNMPRSPEKRIISFLVSQVTIKRLQEVVRLRKGPKNSGSA